MGDITKQMVTGKFHPENFPTVSSTNGNKLSD